MVAGEEFPSSSRGRKFGSGWVSLVSWVAGEFAA